MKDIDETDAASGSSKDLLLVAENRSEESVVAVQF